MECFKSVESYLIDLQDIYLLFHGIRIRKMGTESETTCISCQLLKNVVKKIYELNKMSTLNKTFLSD